MRKRVDGGACGASLQELAGREVIEKTDPGHASSRQPLLFRLKNSRRKTVGAEMLQPPRWLSSVVPS